MARTTDRPARVLAVVTSAGSFEKTGRRTGLWLGELTHVQDVLEKAGHLVTVASIDGGRVPIDPESLSALVLKLGDTQARYEDPAYMRRLEDTPSLDDVAGDDWDAVFLAGGHGAMFDFPDSEALAKLLAKTYDAGRVVAAVCHGPAGLLNVTLDDGSHLLEGRKVTGFAWKEEKAAGRNEVVPFRLDEALKEKGAKYSAALIPMAAKVVKDGNLVTGQNPTSATGVGEAIVALLKKRPSA